METKDTVVVLKNAPLLVRLEPSLKAKLLAKSERLKVSAASIVRDLVRAYVGVK